MDVFSIGVVALCAVLAGAVIRRSGREHALLLSLAAAVAVLLAVLGDAEPVVRQVGEMAAEADWAGEAVRLMLRAVGITVVGQVVSRLCKDAGESALGYTVDLAARVAVLAASLPAVGKVLELLGDITTL